MNIVILPTENYFRMPSSVNVLFNAFSVEKMDSIKAVHCMVHRITEIISITFSEL